MKRSWKRRLLRSNCNTTSADAAACCSTIRAKTAGGWKAAYGGTSATTTSRRALSCANCRASPEGGRHRSSTNPVSSGAIFGFPMRRLAAVIALLMLAPSARMASGQQAPPASNDLDRFMEQVLARRDDNWKKLQQYILDEQERAELRGPGGTLVWGQQRDYTWYVRDEYFVRSPVRFNGVTISEGDRQNYEDNFLKQAKERDKRGQKNAAAPSSAESAAAPSDIQGLITQTREPQFISSAYFLQFKFEPGRYALVAREKIDNRDVLKIEYYPTRLFQEDPKTRTERRVRQAASKADDDAYTAEMQRLMNK